MKILHLLHRSVPGTHGYAIRSREIIKKQKEAGLEPMVVTSPSQAPLGKPDSEGSEYIDGVRYFRTSGRFFPGTVEVYDPNYLISALRVLQNFFLLKKALWIARTYKPAIIHSHSPFTCGIIGNVVGKILNIPTIYEVRGIWEDSHTSRHGLKITSIRYQAVRRLENLAMTGADLCCPICEALSDELARRGIDRSKMEIVPNGVDVKAFVPGKDSGLKAALGLQNKRILGYIGSFFHYEGLDLLVEATAVLSRDFPDLALLMVGEGELSAKLKLIAQERGISERVIMPGRVPHELVADYYRICDIMVLPRRDTAETRQVTPLKPLEIMAMAKPMVAADIGGHRELIRDGVNGVLFKAEDIGDLVKKCRELLNSEQARLDLGERSLQWVKKERDWSILINKYISIYSRLAGS